MRCIAKIAEVVYPKLELRPTIPLTPRRRTASISLPYNTPSPLPHSDGAKDAESEGETVDLEKGSEGHRDEGQRSSDNAQMESDDSSSGSESSSPESSASKCRDLDGRKTSCAMMKMLFEILQNFLADIITILEKVLVEHVASLHTATFALVVNVFLCRSVMMSMSIGAGSP